MMRFGALTLALICFSSFVYGEKPSYDAVTSRGQRTFIAHRGVNLRSTIAGENSLEAIGMSTRGGFGAIETDVRLSADDSLVVMHDATLNRTCLNADGSPIAEDTPVDSKTWRQLREGYILKADRPSMRSRIPSLREYLQECRKQGIYTFIEPKLNDSTGRFYSRIIALAEEILGHGNYVVTSNNRANDVIRDTLGVADVRLMGILYQTTFDRINRLGNCIMAISASRIAEPEYSQQMACAKEVGLQTESHADKFAYFNRINSNPVDYVSTDFLAADLGDCGTMVADLGTLSDFAPATVSHGAILLPEEDSVAPSHKLPKVEYGGAYLSMDFDGKVEITLGRQTFTATGSDNLRHQVLLYDEVPEFKVKALSPDVRIRRITLKIMEY